MPLEEMKNTGFLEALPRGTDFIAGAENELPYEIRLESGVWDMFLPDDEQQVGLYFDTFACVTFSGNNSVETQLDKMLRTGEMSAQHEKAFRDLGVLVGDRFNFSDRFAAKMNGTTPTGNYLVNYWESARHDGLVAESAWPWEPRQRTPVVDYNEYFKEIPDDVKALGKELLKYIEIRYQWVITANYGPVSASLPVFTKYLKMAPIQIAHPTCSPYNITTPIQPCGKFAASHATMSRANLDPNLGFYDSYDPYRKMLSGDYPVPFGLLGVVYLKDLSLPLTPTPKPIFNMSDFLKNNQNKIVQITEPGVEGSGSFTGIIVGDTLRTVNIDKLTEGEKLILTALVRNNFGVGVKKDIYDQMPKQPL